MTVMLVKEKYRKMILRWSRVGCERGDVGLRTGLGALAAVNGIDVDGGMKSLAPFGDFRQSNSEYFCTQNIEGDIVIFILAV
jgi:hypothetical protein